MDETIAKSFFFWQFYEEQQWLNAMSKDGYLLCDVKGKYYTFTRTAIGNGKIFFKKYDGNINDPRIQSEISSMVSENTRYLCGFSNKAYFKTTSNVTETKAQL